MGAPDHDRAAMPKGESNLAGCVAFFGHDSAESTVIKRIRAFTAQGLEVLGFNFRRDKFSSGGRRFWENIHLGVTEDRAYGRRLLALCRALPRILRHRRRLRRVEFFYARNIDMCALALAARWLSRASAPVVYEVLDVQRVFIGRGIVSALFRWAERRLLNRIDLLVVSSPGFIENYFRSRQGYRGRCFLLENKISFAQAVAVERPREAPLVDCAAAEVPARWVIGWFGTLRCPKSLDILCQIAAALPDKVEIYMRGVPTETGQETFERAIAGHPNMIYGGEYRNPGDLAEIYGRVHLTWAFDFLDEGSNSKWLLPNRIYEGGYFGSVALAARDSQTGEKLREHGLGYTFEAPEVENLIAFLRWYSIDEHLARRAQVLSLPASAFCDVYDTRDLCEVIFNLPQPSSRRATASMPRTHVYEQPGE
ncbi:MAG: glycosyltransferase [Kiloniellaceae bacterium]